MKLSEIFTQLAYGELVQMGVLNKTRDGILPAKYGQLVAHVNLGLNVLFKRFNLKESSTLITLMASKLTYALNTDSDTIFMETMEIPEFKNNITKIERVYTSSDYELSLNDESDEYSCFTPELTVLRVPLVITKQSNDLPADLKTKNLRIVYRASHPVIEYTSTGFNPALVEVELPSSHLEPLLYFIASRANNPMGMSAGYHAGDGYFGKYEKACMELEVRNIRVDQGKQNSKLLMHGWV